MQFGAEEVCCAMLANNSSLHTPVQNVFLTANALRAGGQNAAAARIGGKKRRSNDLDAAAFPQLPFGCPLQLVAACRGALTGNIFEILGFSSFVECKLSSNLMIHSLEE